MQAVKDTQSIIDETLGIGGGLLQRCCFFGQHSHTLHSLLGDSHSRSHSCTIVNACYYTLQSLLGNSHYHSHSHSHSHRHSYINNHSHTVVDACYDTPTQYVRQ